MIIKDKDKRLIASILTDFMFAESYDEFLKVWQEIFDKYELCSDPFTGTPCTWEEYCKNKLKFEKQIMIEKYGHCDGLE